jgi:NADPH:quinone reductase-like Zn-dependent oxidoreductase
VRDKKTMKALLLRRHGSLDDLDVVSDYPVPAAVEGHVVIRVRASSFNYHDVFTIRGMPGIKVPLPVIPGLDMASEIAEVGPGVAAWKVGDRVLVNPVNPKEGPDGRDARRRDGGILPASGEASVRSRIACQRMAGCESSSQWYLRASQLFESRRGHS